MQCTQTTAQGDWVGRPKLRPTYPKQSFRAHFKSDWKCPRVYVWTGKFEEKFLPCSGSNSRHPA